MLTAVTELPMQGGRERSQRRVFAGNALAEMQGQTAPLAEVTGWPKLDDDPVRDAEKMRAALYDEAFSMGLRDRVRVIRRGSRVFLKRIEPFGRKDQL